MTNLFLFFHNTQRHSKLLYSSLISIFSLCCRFRFKNAHTKRHIKHKKKSIYYFALFFTHNKLFILYVAGKFFIFIIFFLLLVFISFIISLMQFILLKAMLVWLRSEIGNWNRCDDERAKKQAFQLSWLPFRHDDTTKAPSDVLPFVGKLNLFLSYKTITTDRVAAFLSPSSHLRQVIETILLFWYCKIFVFDVVNKFSHWNVFYVN